MFDVTQQIGEERSYNHGEDCLKYGASSPDSRSRCFVKRIFKGWVWYCHNCNGKGFRNLNGDISLSETKERINAKLVGDTQVYSSRNVYLPSDFTYDIPIPCGAWLGKYGITEDERRSYHLGYSVKLNRLILPLYNKEGELIYWQGRNCGKITKDNPKYINVRSNKSDFAVMHPPNNTSDRVCIVEDILSAIKVGRHIHAIPILGSYVNTKLLQKVREYANIFVWLDKDKMFQSIKYTNRIRLFTGKSSKSIITDLDPKEYDDNKIKELLCST